MTCDPDALQLGHELAVEAAHCVAGEEANPFSLQVAVDLSELRHQGLLALVVLLCQHQLKLAVHVFDDTSHLFILKQNKNITQYDLGVTLL